MECANCGNIAIARWFDYQTMSSEDVSNLNRDEKWHIDEISEMLQRTSGIALLHPRDN
jgi:hypothetical protein